MPSSLTLRCTRAPAIAALFALGLATGLAGTARADDVKECAAASEDGQLLRMKGKLREARAKFVECARASCPAIVKRDCDQWLSEVDASIPTAVITARDSEQHDISTVRVSLDGAPFLERLDGTAAAVDAGEHVLRFEKAGAAAIEQHVVIREGEKNRMINVVFPAAAPAPATETAPPQAPETNIAGYVFGGVGIVALGLAAYFEVASLNEYSNLKNTCAPAHACLESQVNSVLTYRYVAVSALGAGVISLGVATWLFLHRSTTTAPSPATAFDLVPLPGGGAASVRVRF